MINEMVVPDDAKIKEVIRQEYIKCVNNPIYFMRRYCMIQHPTKGRMMFNLYDFQENVLSDLQNHRHNIILKSRQLGISTVAAGFAMWEMNFFDDKNILIIATKQDVAKNLFHKVRFMYQNLPTWLKSGFIEDNKLSLKLKNGSQIKAIASSEDAGRSEALSRLIIDEAAFIQNNIVEKIWTSAQQTLGTGGGSIVLSTPNGKGNWFHKMWTGAEIGDNGFNTISLPWHVHPERDDAWRVLQDKQLGLKDAAQECLDGDQIVTILENKEIRNIKLKNLYVEYQHHTNLIKILTPSGFRGFDKISKIVKDRYIKFELSNGLIVNSSTNHIFRTNNNNIFAIDLKVGDSLDTIKNNELITIKEMAIIDSTIELYDVVNCKDPNNLFIFNYNIISHNCDCDFSSSGMSVIDAKDLDYYNKTFVVPPVEKLGTQTELWVFERAIPGHNYIVSADVARGDGGDYSAFHVLDVLDNGTLKQVAEFKGKLDTIAYANLLFNVATEYNVALLIVENNNIGWSVVSKLIELRYSNLYYSLKNNSPLIDFDRSLNSRYDLKQKEDMVPGFSTTSATRNVMLEKMEEYVREKTILIQSKRSLSELETFIWNGQKAEAMRGYNDDLVMALAIGIWVRETAFRLRTHGLNLTKHSLSSIKKTGGMSSTAPVGREYWKDPSTNTDLKWLI